jgi:hypothetical protein
LLGDYDYSDVDTLDQWSRTTRAHWHTHRLDMLAQAASDLESHGQIAGALSWWRQCCCRWRSPGLSLRNGPSR